VWKPSTDIAACALTLTSGSWAEDNLCLATVAESRVFLSGGAMNQIELQTREVVDRLYAAYFAGDPRGMLATMSKDVHMRFLGRGTFPGIEAATRFLTQNTGLLTDLDFRIRAIVVDGEWAAAIWDETATTIHGDPYENHGVDVFRVRDGEVTVLHENNDISIHRAAFGRNAF
jgi:ketosteroid isomerase-like protein